MGLDIGTRRSATLFVRFEYVDVHGELQMVGNKEELRAASGCFGLLGVITYLTFELDPMS